MPSSTSNSLDCDIVRLLEATGRQNADMEYGRLSEEEKAAACRTVREIEGAVVEIKNEAAERIAQMTILGLDRSVTGSDLVRLLNILADDGVRKVRVRVLKSDRNAALLTSLEHIGFKRKQGGVHWLAPANTASASNSGHDIRRIGQAEAAEFARIVAINYHFKPRSDLGHLIARPSDPHHACFLEYVDGAPVATGSASITGSISELGYGTTLKEYRGRGIHRAVIAARVQHAQRAGCEWVTASTMGFDRSSRNLKREGFMPAYIIACVERSC
jgi:GNAT superfamily N-acetyltransferase